MRGLYLVSTKTHSQTLLFPIDLSRPDACPLHASQNGGEMTKMAMDLEALQGWVPLAAVAPSTLEFPNPTLICGGNPRVTSSSTLLKLFSPNCSFM